MNLVRFVKCHSPAELPNTPPLPLLDYNDEVTEKLGESKSFFFLYYRVLNMDFFPRCAQCKNFLSQVSRGQNEPRQETHDHTIP